MEPTPQALARTYTDRVYPDPWEKVLDYRRVQEYAAEHPKAGRVRVGRALELPASRVRGWLDDGVPDPVRAINTAIDHGWLEPEPDNEVAAGLVDLLAHVLAGGSISKKWFTPAVAPGRRVDLDEIRHAFKRVGVETTTRNADADSRATELVPKEDASVLGRCLVTMGAAHGDKTTLERLPPVVWEVPAPARRSFAQIYVRHRGLNYDDKSTKRIQVNRPASFIQDLRYLLDDVVDGSVTVDDGGITIPADTVRELRAA